jgi:hypothetical protein
VGRRALALSPRIFSIRLSTIFATLLAAFALHPLAAGAQIAPPEPAAPVTAAPLPNPAITEPPAVPAITASPMKGAQAPTPTPATGRRLAAFRVIARRVAFYSNRYIVGADDDVVVTLGDGTRITGNTFFMDLRLNRFVIAGNVRVFAAGKEIDGAAFAEYFDFDRAYFVPITTEPDRWTFVAGDYAHPALGRQMPGDTFFLPDLSGERVFLYANRAVVDPRESVRFAPAKLNFGLDTFVTFPSYFLTFSQNPNYAQNALPGAYIDGPLDFAGGENGLSAAHIRYDSLNGIFPALEQHLIGQNYYLVAAASPLTRPLKQYNLLGFDRISPGLQAQFLVQEIAFQKSFQQPLSATAYAQLQVTASLPHSYLQLQTDQYYESLLAQPAPGIDGSLYYGDPSHGWIPYHPFDATLSWVGFRHKLRHYPLSFQLRSSLGFAHNGLLPLEELGGVNYDTIYTKAAGINITTDSLPIVRDRRHRDLYVTASVDRQRQYYSVPHHTDTSTENISLTKLVDPQKLTVFVSYTNQHVTDDFGSQQAIAYTGTTAVNPFTGEVIPGYAAFKGFATSRSFTEQLVYTPNQIFNLNFSMRENSDFPAAVPGYPEIIGDNLAFLNYGVPPYQATLEVRYRFSRQLVLDVSRSYYFNFGGYQRWQPNFSVQVER